MTDTTEQVADVSNEVAPSEVSEPTTSDWRESLPDSIKGHEGLKSIKDVGALANSYLHAQSMVGADKIAIPRKHSTDDDWAEVYSKLGRPDEATSYKLDIADGSQVDEDFLKAFKDASHTAGLSQRQAEKLSAWYQQLSVSQSEIIDSEYAKQQEVAVTELKKEWGKAYDERTQLAGKVLQEFGDVSLSEMKMSDGSLVGDNAEVVKLLANVGNFIKEKTSEDVFTGETSSPVMTPDEANSKIRELTATDSPYWDAKHKDHNYYVEETMRLREFT